MGFGQDENTDAPLNGVDPADGSAQTTASTNPILKVLGAAGGLFKKSDGGLNLGSIMGIVAGGLGGVMLGGGLLPVIIGAIGGMFIGKNVVDRQVSAPIQDTSSSPAPRGINSQASQNEPEIVPPTGLPRGRQGARGV